MGADAMNFFMNFLKTFPGRAHSASRYPGIYAIAPEPESIFITSFAIFRRASIPSS